MRASIVVAAHNEGRDLARTLESIIATADQLDYELIVADDATSDGSVDDVRSRFPQIRVVSSEKRQGASATKALGADEARGEVLVFLDGHTKPDPGALERLVQDVEEVDGAAIITPRVSALDTDLWRSKPEQFGCGYALNLETFDCWWIGLAEMQTVEVAKREYYESPALIGCALATSRKLYYRLWGFDKHMQSWGVEDLDLGLKCWLMGSRILHDPKVVISHRFRREFHNYSVPMEHVVQNKLRSARKNYTESVWAHWLEQTRGRHQEGLAQHPEGLWAHVWSLFEKQRPSVEQERISLQGHRLHDEFWYADRFRLSWPRLESTSDLSSAPRFTPLLASPSPSPSPSPAPPYPASLRVVSCIVIPASDTANQCVSPEPYGIMVATTYQIVDQNGNDLSGNDLLPQEHFSNGTLNGSPYNFPTGFNNVGPSSYAGTSLYADATGQFIDAPFGFCANYDFTFTLTQLIRIQWNGNNYTVRQNNFTITGSSGHGAITNGNDISGSR